jgi:hypothetical protein
VLLRPYLHTLKDFGDEALFELAEIAGFNLRKALDGADLTPMILARYMPHPNICVAAEDLRSGAQLRDVFGIQNRAGARIILSETAMEMALDNFSTS